jgi:hypothetical protein
MAHHSTMRFIPFWVGVVCLSSSMVTAIDARAEGPLREEASTGAPRPPPRPRWWAIGTGAGVFALSYGVAVGTWSTNCADCIRGDGYNDLLIPFVGPFLYAGTSNPRNLDNTALFADGVAQLVGLGFVIFGAISRVEPSPSRPSVVVVPSIARLGLVVDAQF